MKTETLQKILNGEKREIRVLGYLYDITVDRETRVVSLVPRSRGWVAYSKTPPDDYGYVHGGDVYRRAVQIAREIEAALPGDTDE